MENRSVLPTEKHYCVNKVRYLKESNMSRGFGNNNKSFLQLLVILLMLLSPMAATLSAQSQLSGDPDCTHPEGHGGLECPGNDDCDEEGQGCLQDEEFRTVCSSPSTIVPGTIEGPTIVAAGATVEFSVVGHSCNAIEIDQSREKYGTFDSNCNCTGGSWGAWADVEGSANYDDAHVASWSPSSVISSSGNFSSDTPGIYQLTATIQNSGNMVACANGPPAVTSAFGVTVVGLKVKAEDAGGAVGAIPLTECMEGRYVTYTAELLGFPPGTDVTYKFYYETAGGTKWNASVVSSTGYADHTPVASQVPTGAANNKFTTPVYVEVVIGGTTIKSNTLNIDVYELWIEYFKDTATDKAWKVCVGDNISFSAIASSDCESWVWDMVDGVPDAWDPTGGNTKSGTTMIIPNSDKARSSNSWYGNAYGTVTVSCEDGDGNSYEIDSTEIAAGLKAKVYFDPATNKSGGAPSTANPPAWHVFWSQAVVSNYAYDHAYPDYGYCDIAHMKLPSNMMGYRQYPVLGRAANSTSTLGNGNTAGGLPLGGAAGTTISGIDNFWITILHESKHYNDAGGAYSWDTDIDFVADFNETSSTPGVYGPGETDPGVLNTHAFSDTGDNEYRAYYAECHQFASEVGKWDSVDWSKGGKQW